MSIDKTRGNAFPHNSPAGQDYNLGMTLREYAAIKLKVADSGNEQLDKMIKQSLWNDFAASALAGHCTSYPEGVYYANAVNFAFDVANAMMAERKKRGIE